MTQQRVGDSSGGPNAAGRRLIAQTFVSMDGVMQAPGGQEADLDAEFRLGGWSMAYWDESMGRAMVEFTSQPADIVLGRRTYDIFAGYWPNHRDRVGSSLNEATKYVASRTGKKLDWENSRLLRGDVVSAIAALKRDRGLPLHVVGSADLLQTLLRQDLVDELELWGFPVVLGHGKRLFQDGAIPTAWKLVRCSASETVVLMQHYERAGEIPLGPASAT